MGKNEGSENTKARGSQEKVIVGNNKAEKTFHLGLAPSYRLSIK